MQRRLLPHRCFQWRRPRMRVCTAAPRWVEAQCSLPEVAWLWSRASTRGAYSNGAWSGHINPGGERAPADAVMHGWISGVHFEEVVAYKFTKERRVSSLEVHAHKTWAIRAAKSPACWRARLALLLDSFVVVGALGRGGSSSRQLNRILRTHLPLALRRCWSGVRGRGVKTTRRMTEPEEKLFGLRCRWMRMR